MGRKITIYKIRTTADYIVSKRQLAPTCSQNHPQFLAFEQTLCKENPAPLKY